MLYLRKRRERSRPCATRLVRMISGKYRETARTVDRYRGRYTEPVPYISYVYTTRVDDTETATGGVRYGVQAEARSAYERCT